MSLSDYQLRAAGFEGYSALVRELGGDPDPLLRQAGIKPEWLENPDHPIAYLAFLSALRLGSQATATPHFGLLLSRKQRFAMLGAVGFAVREAPNVHAAIENLNRFLPVHNQAARTSLVVEGDFARWSFDVMLREAPALDQQFDLVVGVGISLLQHLAGHDWAPLSVHLKRAEPVDTRPYRQFFHSPIVFNADFTGSNFTQRGHAPTRRGNRAPSVNGHPTHCHLRRMRDALAPPKPNELLTTTSTRAAVGSRTTGNWQMGSGVSKPSSGGSHCSRRVIRLTTASTAPAAPNRCPMDALVELTGKLATRPPAHRLIAAASAPSLSGVPVPWALM